MLYHNDLLISYLYNRILAVDNIDMARTNYLQLGRFFDYYYNFDKVKKSDNYIIEINTKYDIKLSWSIHKNEFTLAIKNGYTLIYDIRNYKIAISYGSKYNDSVSKIEDIIMLFSLLCIELMDWYGLL